MRLARIALVCSACLLCPAAAAAQSDDELAKQYYKLGEELYNRADYEGALKQFRQSYDISRRPALLYNMARCQESLGQHEKAIDLLTEYLKSNPDNRTMIEARIANLRRLVERKQPPRLPPATAPTPRPPAVTPPVPPTQPTEPSPPPAPPARPLRVPGWIAVGVGGALLVSGTALGVVAKRKSDELGETQVFSEVQRLTDERNKYRNACIGTLVAGGLVAVTGAVLLILDARSTRATRRAARLIPIFGPDSAGLVGELRF